jgi:hypothetical protein
VKLRRPKFAAADLERFYPSALHTALKADVTMLSGFVFPASRKSTVSIQRLAHRHWRTVMRVRVGRGGSYAVSLTAAGSYRVLYGGVAGETVAIG